jgi:aminoglycoside phosphotransferase
MKKLPAGIQENLQFLCVEVDSQVDTLEQYFRSHSSALARRVRDRSGYAYNLRTRIHMATANWLATNGHKHDTEKFTLRCIEFIATDLERVTEICRNSISQSELLDEFDYVMEKPFITILKKVRKALKLIIPALTARQTDIAIEIDQINQEIKGCHERLMKRYLNELKKHNHTEKVTQAMFIAYELKQLSQVLLNISESIISSNLGQPVNFERYYSLQSLISTEDQFAISPIAETRSGSAISGVSSSADSDGFFAIYKDGQKQKLKEEKEGLNSWKTIYPGLAPKILTYQKKGESASLLIEHLPGSTMEKIVLGDDELLLKQSLKQLKVTLNAVWTDTKNKKVNPACFMVQLQKRLPEVYKIHPQFEHNQHDICGHEITSINRLLEIAQEKEQQFPPPFSVYIHGDFNVDNIIYDPIEKRINFIDLHRSRYMDYVQDVAIFMVSNYRLRIIDIDKRKQILGVAIDMYKHASRFAKQQNDTTFELRLAFGLARAFATSTRFILDKALAKRMFARARYLIEQAVKVEHEQVARFKVPVKELFVE